MQSWNDYAKIVAALFVIANPVGVIPTFISLTGGYSMADKRHTSRVTAATVFIVLVAAAVSGEHLLHFFGVGLDFKALLALALRPLAAGASVHASSDFPESSIR